MLARTWSRLLLGLALADCLQMAPPVAECHDHTNDDAVHMNAAQQQLLKRSGFDYEEHFAIADDGYITLLVRVVNPRAERHDLRSPPVMLYHGGLIDQTSWLVASSIQHWPEPWPRKPSDGPMSSSNRSLAFMLANNGFDLWLVGTRGSNRHNQGHTNQVALARAETNFRLAERHFELIDKHRDKYWSFGLDELVRDEFREQIDTVLRATGRKEVSIFTYSLSAPSSMAFLATNVAYARRVRVYFQMAPAIAPAHTNPFSSLYFLKLCPLMPTRGVGVIADYWITALIHRTIVALSRWRLTRDSLVDYFLSIMSGKSAAQRQTNLELNYLGHIFLPMSFKSFQHYCQSSKSNTLAKFDYGPAKNSQLYGQARPPEYNLSRLEVQNWVVVSGSEDALSGPGQVRALLERTSPLKPAAHIVCPGFNHMDLQVAADVDKYVNLPVLAILSANADPPPQRQPPRSGNSSSS